MEVLFCYCLFLIFLVLKHVWILYFQNPISNPGSHPIPENDHKGALLKRQAWNLFTLPETNIAHENPIFPGKYHQNGGFSMAMLVWGSVTFKLWGIPYLVGK